MHDGHLRTAERSVPRSQRGRQRRSAVNLDSVESVAIAVLAERIAHLADVRMSEVCAAVEIAVDRGG